MIHGFLRVCTLSPSLRVADCPYNAKMTVEAMRQAAADGAQLAVFPELGLTGYTCSDLFLQEVLLRRAKEELLALNGVKPQEGVLYRAGDADS